MAMLAARADGLALVGDRIITFPYPQRHILFMGLFMALPLFRLLWGLTLVPALLCCFVKWAWATALSVGIAALHCACCILFYLWFLECGYRYLLALVSGTPP
ncbi:MAG: hypothetical protein GX595_17605 [Lentisphaerae bacterium]|nr:hypothetical protein [Lentisphaerota bacterium]